jgi:hypothetical protein
MDDVFDVAFVIRRQLAHGNDFTSARAVQADKRVAQLTVDVLVSEPVARRGIAHR